jgi:hypothetical protein
MPATATRKKPSAVLKTELGADGKLKHTLPAKEAAKLARAYGLLCLLLGVPGLLDEASKASAALEAVMTKMGVRLDQSGEE